MPNTHADRIAERTRGRPKGTAKPSSELRSINSETSKIIFQACDKYTTSKKKNEMWKLYLTLLWQTGVRPSEALAIKVSDVSSDRIRIYRLKRRKTTVDYVPIQPQLHEKIKGYCGKYRARGMLFPVSYAGAANMFAHVREIAKLSSDYTLHSFRHGFASRFLQRYSSRVDASAYLQMSLGHSTLNNSYGPYHVATFDEVKEDIDSMKF